MLISFPESFPESVRRLSCPPNQLWRQRAAKRVKQVLWAGSIGKSWQVLLENYGELIPVYPADYKFYPKVQIVAVAAEQRIAVEALMRHFSWPESPTCNSGADQKRQKKTPWIGWQPWQLVRSSPIMRCGGFLSHGGSPQIIQVI